MTLPYRKLFLIIFGAIILLGACRKENVQQTTSSDTKYFPLYKRKTAIYKVIQITIDKASAINDTTQYLLKEVIDTCFLDDEQDTVWRMMRYKKLSDTSAWTISDVWTAKRTPFNAQTVEDNRRYVKLIFPVRIGQQWDGNQYNNQKQETYKMTKIESEKVETLQYDSLLTVEQKNEQTLISKIYKVEKYAPRIGLVYKENTDLYSQDVVSGLPVEQRIERGTIYIQYLIQAE